MKKLSVFFTVLMILGCVFMAFTGCNDEKDPPTINNNNEDQTEKPYMVCIGDSITYGQEVVKEIGEGEYDYEQMKNPYPSIIKTKLRYDVENLAVGGATLCTNVHRELGNANSDVRPTMHDQVAGIEGTPDIISVMGGVNDWGLVELGDSAPTNKDSKTLYGGIRTLCATLKSNYPEAFIFFMTPVKVAGYEGERNGYTLEKIADVMKEVCAEYEIPVYDSYNEIVIDPTDKTICGDGVHQSQDFVKEELAPKIIAFIEANYKK